MAISHDDIRANAPILTRRQTADIVGMPMETLSKWTRTRPNRIPMIHSVHARHRGWPTIPLVGLAESSVLRGLRDGGMSMHQARMASEYIREKSGDPFALANPSLVTDGTFAYLASDDSIVRVSDGQFAFMEVLKGHLRPLILGSDGFVTGFRLEDVPGLMIDPEYNGGRACFEKNKMPAFPIVDGLRAGETRDSLAKEYALTLTEVTDIERNIDWLEKFA